MTPELTRLVDWYETLSQSSLSTIADYYSDDCYFKDPFNEVRSRDIIHSIYMDMFEKLDSPRFVFEDVLSDGNKAFLTWRFSFGWRNRQMTIQGGSHLVFSDDGRVEYHRDYWDVAEELYEKIPVMGWILRRIKNMAKA